MYLPKYIGQIFMKIRTEVPLLKFSFEVVHVTSRTVQNTEISHNFLMWKFYGTHCKAPENLQKLFVPTTFPRQEVR